MKQKRLTKAHRNHWLLYAFFFLYFINLLTEKIERSQETGKSLSWISTGMFGLILLMFLGLLIDIIFRQYWKTKVDITEIDKIKIYSDEEGLETNVMITLQSKRYKILAFRTLEKQVDSFVDSLRSINPAIKLTSK